MFPTTGGVKMNNKVITWLSIISFILFFACVEATIIFCDQQHRINQQQRQLDWLCEAQVIAMSGDNTNHFTNGCNFKKLEPNTSYVLHFVDYGKKSAVVSRGRDQLRYHDGLYTPYVCTNNEYIYVWDIPPELLEGNERGFTAPLR